MRVLLTGGTGFIGTRLARRLRQRGDEVVALVRSATRATALDAMGCSIVVGNINDTVALDRACEGVDSVFHLAARFEVGILKTECAQMQDVNVGGVRVIMDACINANVPRVVYASTINVFGNTHGATVDEAHQRNIAEGFYSCYDESKYRAHMLVQDRIERGAPVVMVMPGVVYGPGDHFETGREILAAARGRLPALMLAEVGLDMVYVDDVVEGFLLAHDKGTAGSSYVLGGENTRLREVLARAASLGGHELTKREISTGFLKFVSVFGPVLAPRFGYPPNVKELIKASDGVTYWANDDKARAELGYAPRGLDAGLRDFLTTEGVVRASAE